MSDFTYEIVKHIAILSSSQRNWRKELNLIKWGGRKAKYDIRSWTENREKMGKGISLSLEELFQAVKILENFVDDITKTKKGIPVGESKYGCELIRECGVLTRNSKGWTSEVNIVIWGKNEPCFDIRNWGPNRAFGKGVTLNSQEAEQLILAVQKYFTEADSSVDLEQVVEIEDKNSQDLIEEIFLK